MKSGDRAAAGSKNSALHDKLRRLRREQAKPSPGGSNQDPPRKGGMPTWLRAHLARKTGPPAQNVGGDSPLAKSLGAPAELLAERNERGAFWVREVRHAVGSSHGDWALGEVLGVRSRDLALLAKDQALERLDPARAIYLDIETTGLSGGAGTTAFLVALGWFEGEAPQSEFVLWQGFLAGPEEEAALLHAVAGRVAASSGVVSFFGKSFDRHRLEDKMRIHGIAPPFEDRPHLDLYHPLRRLYREALENAKLQTMERELCGVTRQDDLPGSFAPAAWFDFLGQRAHRLEDVFRHNADDVLSLVVLAAHLGCSLRETRGDGRQLSGSGASRAKGMVRVLDALRRRGEACAWLERYRERVECEDDPAFERICGRVRRARDRELRSQARGA